MQYKLYENGNNDTSNPLKEVLKNRGIDDYYTYLNLDESVVNDYHNLDNIEEAVTMFKKHFDNHNKIGILVDEDPDGFCSGAMMYSYIKRIDVNYPVTYIMHNRSKSHGLSDDVIIPKEINLLIIPDAGTNDVIQCMELNVNDNIDVLILDHHELEEDNSGHVYMNMREEREFHTIVVNNQTSEKYTNKNLCGAGVVYQFLRALDEEFWNDFADEFLDLCALANISDVMDIRSFETKYLIDIGLLNVKNKFFQALINAQEYSMKGKVNIHTVQWYCTPIINGMIRTGTQDEKELLFKAFIEQDEFFEYKKRATKDKPSETIQESIYDRAARLSKNAKSRQDKKKDKSVAEIIKIAESIPFDDKVVMLDATEVLDVSLTGVTAIKIAEYFNKPCILLKKHIDEKTGKVTFGGSARNIDNSPIDSFKDIVNSTNVFNFANGHPNAFGVDINTDKINEAINSFNEILKDVVYDSTYKVDYILDINNVDVRLINDINKLEDIVGTGIKEPLIAIENIYLEKDEFQIFGKTEDTVSFEINGIKYIMFKCKEGNGLYDFLQNAWEDDNSITFNIVGKPSINEFNGVRTPQITIEDLIVIKTNIDNYDDEEINDEDNWDEW